MIYIYRLTNLETRMSYVGMTQSVRKRWAVQKCQAKAGKYGPLMDALREYGSDVFVCDILQESETTEMAYVLERAWIIQLGTLAPGGYNQYLGKKWDASAKQKQSARLKGVAMTPLQKAAHAKMMQTPEYSANMIRALSASARNKERIAKLRREGHTLETLEKMSAATIRQFSDPAERERARKANRRQFTDPVMRERHRLACLASIERRKSSLH